MSGKQIKLFLVDGTPGGVTTAEITNWTGHVLAGSRSDLADLLKRDETSRTGVYFLLRDDDDALGNTSCYIGETDVIANRLRTHDAMKEWDRAVIVTSKDANLTKAHARYLEARLVELAKAAARVSVENGTAQGFPRSPRPTARTWTTSSRNSRSCCPSSVSTPYGCPSPSRLPAPPRPTTCRRSSGPITPRAVWTPRLSRSTASSPCWPGHRLCRRGMESVKLRAPARPTCLTAPSMNSCSRMGAASLTAIAVG